mmetsp:Transcript_10473/g.26905  ORF Transcript_10473/g.26905 Transcript_10473/m.26905 type:complete len:420 (+) Transcript_10473:2-1261(+)
MATAAASGGQHAASFKRQQSHRRSTAAGPTDGISEAGAALESAEDVGDGGGVFNQRSPLLLVTESNRRYSDHGGDAAATHRPPAGLHTAETTFVSLHDSDPDGHVVVRRRRSKGILSRIIDIDSEVINNPSRFFEDLPTYLVQRSTTAFAAFTLLTYIVLCVIFAALYMYDIENCLTQTNAGGTSSASDSFTDAFFFSVQTISTVGYGSRSPVCAWSESISALQCFTGLIYIAIITGLLYARFTRPMTRLMLSDVVCIDDANAPGRALGIRVANGHKVPAMAVEASVVVSLLDTTTASRRFHKLPLLAEGPGWLGQSETLTHPIGPKSPLYGMDEAAFAAAGGMIHVVVHALNGVLLTPMVVTATYGAGSTRPVVFGARLAPMTTFNVETDSLVHDFAKISAYETRRHGPKFDGVAGGE